VPKVVSTELASRKSPAAVQKWINNPPAWLKVLENDRQESHDTSLEDLDAGERAAIQLARAIHADLLLMDDRQGVTAARAMGIRATGTLGVLDVAADRLVDFGLAIEKLARTNFPPTRQRA
jgi:predicted nucleic acid-binding protein